MRTTTKWLVVAAINAGALTVGSFLATEWFIARKRKVTIVYESNEHYRHSLYPNQRYERAGGSYEIGAHRLRGREPLMPKPEGVQRVFVMGGSSVFDFLVDPSWPERMEDVLRARGIPRVEVFNAGVPGFSTREVVPFYEEVVRAYDPDIVVLYAGWNDVKYMRTFADGVELEPFPSASDPTASRAYRWLLAPRPLRNWYAFPLMIEKLRRRTGLVEENEAPRTTDKRSANVEPIVWGDSPGMNYFEDNVRAFVRAVRSDGARPILAAECTLAVADLSPALRKKIQYRYVKVDHETLVRLNGLMVNRLRTFAATAAVDFIDVRSKINGRPAYFSDHVHLSTEGSQAVADAVGAALPIAEWP